MKKYLFSELIEEITELNTELLYGLDDIVGVTIEKGLIPTIANLTKTELNKFYIVKPDTFVFNPRTHGVRLGMGYNDTENTYITSWNNVAFKVKDEARTLLNPEYLWLFFNRTEWDRETNYHAWGSSTIVFSWNTFRNLSIKLPEKEVQDKIVRQYKVIKNRIKLKKQINDNLEATVQAIFKSKFIDYERANYSDYIEFEFGKYPATWNLVDLDTAVDVRDGTHDSPSPTESGKYLITSRHLLPYAVDRSDAYFISEADFKKANERSKVEYGDILFSMIGTIGIISFITDKEVDFAIKNVGLFRTSQNPTIRYFILSYLKSKIVENYISSYMAGSTQSYVSLNVLRKIPLILPTEDVLQHFEKQVTPLYAKMIENTHEIAKLNDLKDVITTSMSSR